MNIAIIIPARGGSKGIPRKNLRALNGKPLISYSIEIALASRYNPDVFVTTEDSEIAAITYKIGAKVIDRPSEISGDSTTLDPVIFNAFKTAEKIKEKSYDLIVTLQPTSPLLKTETLDKAISRFKENASLMTLISAQEDTHLSWRIDGDKYLPNYTERLNRQYLPKNFRETGGFVISRSEVVSRHSRIGNNTSLFLLSGPESIDIDTYEDWSLCEYYLKKKRILFVVSGYSEIGLGHVYNALLLANDIVSHEIEFLVDSKSQLAFDAISLRNYSIRMQKNKNLNEDIKEINPDVIINDRLDTKKVDIEELKSYIQCTIVNFEDLGSGALEADLVINAIYPEETPQPNHYFGPDYFLIRDEFLLTEAQPVNNQVKRCLLTFGGTDANSLTEKVLESINSYCLEHNIVVDVVTGLGYEKQNKLVGFKSARIHNNTTDISSFMANADVIFTSAGRTTYEIAFMQVPAIVIAQNKRETTHFFANAQYGFLNLGLGEQVTPKEILESFKKLVESFELRQHMSLTMANYDLSKGRQCVLGLINSVVEKA